jgi:aminopeptidase YwaD
VEIASVKIIDIIFFHQSTGSKYHSSGGKMNTESLTLKASNYLNELCVKIPSRRMGSQGNRDATALFKSVMEQFGFTTETQSFQCVDMRQGEIRLNAGGHDFEAFISPYTIRCDVSADLVTASTVEELEEANITGKILLLREEIAKEQLMPKNFVFYNPEEHQRIYRLLEEKQPAAVITATSRNPDAVGAIYPFPMIEDGDFNFPTAFMTDVEGDRLALQTGKTANLTMDAQRIPSTGENIVARTGANMDKKVVVCAHIDAKAGTPGALDNASGTAILMLLGELLRGYDGRLGVEIVALNGEEYYCAPGQMEYLRLAEGTYQNILLAINLDDIGYYKDRSAFSLYGVPDEIADLVRKVYGRRPEFFEGPEWYQSDHGIFIANGIPAMAVTEESFQELLAEITHSEKDRPDIVDPAKLVANASVLYDLIIEMNKAL